MSESRLTDWWFGWQRQVEAWADRHEDVLIMIIEVLMMLALGALVALFVASYAGIVS